MSEMGTLLRKQTTDKKLPLFLTFLLVCLIKKQVGDKDLAERWINLVLASSTCSLPLCSRFVLVLVKLFFLLRGDFQYWEALVWFACILLAGAMKI